MVTLLFGSIGTIADTSELQRQAFNEAFAHHGLDWHWSQEEYRDLLASNGGKDRVAAYAKSTGTQVDAPAVHATKSERYRALLASSDLKPRAGVMETIREGLDQGSRIGFVTTTSSENVDAVLQAMEPALSRDDFAVIVDRSDVDTGKPAGDAYRYALQQLGVDAASCVAIEDNVGGVQAAAREGVPCVAFPNANTAGHDFDGALCLVDALDFSELRALAGDAA